MRSLSNSHFKIVLGAAVSSCHLLTSLLEAFHSEWLPVCGNREGILFFQTLTDCSSCNCLNSGDQLVSSCRSFMGKKTGSQGTVECNSPNNVPVCIS